MRSKILLHICCAPCALYPLEVLNDENLNITGFWFNPNIHPYLEYKKRLFEVQKISKILNFPLIVGDNYEIEEYLKWILDRDGTDRASRCKRCYKYRLSATAKYAAENDFDAFTTTLLYSKYQNHKVLKSLGEKFAENFGVKFLYRDFREGWSRGIKLSRKLKLYRQQYCGCIFSEYERFEKTADLVLQHYEWIPRRKEDCEAS